MRLISPNICLYFFLIALGITGFFFAVIWPYQLGFYAFIAFAALGGLGVACYIYYTKKSHKQLVCPVGSDCNVVVTSRYSKFLGISLEYWGILYYGIIVTAYGLLIFAPQALAGPRFSVLIILTTIAFLFSLYLLFIQAFLIRQWCIWCLLSALLSIVIFIVSLSSLDLAVAFLNEITGILKAIHGLGFVVGMGGATTAILLFTRFLRDLDIDEQELQIFKSISELVWLGLVFTFVSHFALYIVSAGTLARSGLFLVQTIALFIVLFAGAVLNIIFAPLLVVMPFTEESRQKKKNRSPLQSIRNPFFVTGAISLSSWYFAFSLNYLPEYRFSSLLFAYLAVTVISILTALFLEKRVSRNVVDN